MADVAPLQYATDEKVNSSGDFEEKGDHPEHHRQYPLLSLELL